MRGTEVYRVLDSAASSTSSKLNKIFLERYHYEMDEMFARLHFADRHGHYTADGAAERDEYLAIHRDMTSDEIHSQHLEDKVYRRYSFESRADMNRFISYLNDPANHVPQEVLDKVVAAPVRIHGKWLMEMPDRITEGDNIIDTNRFVIAYQERSGTDVQAYNYRADYGGDGYTDGSVRDTSTGIFMGEFIANTGELGQFFRVAGRINQLVNVEGDIDQRHALTANTRYGEHGKQEGGFFTGANGHQQNAKVFGDKVIKDGRDITDSALGRRVLEMHRQRVRMADHYLNSHRHRRIESAKQAIDDNDDLTYAQKQRHKHRVDNRAGERQARMAANAQAIHDAAAHQTYATGRSRVGRFNGGVTNGYRRVDGGIIDKMRNDYGEQAILLKMTAGDVTISETLWSALEKSSYNMNAVGITQREKDFIDGIGFQLAENGFDPLSFTHEDRIMMTDIVDKIERYQRNDSTFLDANEISAVNRANERTSDNGQFRYSEAELQYYGLNIGVVRQINAIRDDLGIDLDFAGVRDTAIREIQLTHIDPNLAPILGLANIEFDSSDSTFTDSFAQTYSKSNIKDALRDVKETVLSNNDLSYIKDRLAKNGKILSKEDAIKELKAISDMNGDILMSRNVTFDGSNYHKGNHILTEDETLEMLESRLDKIDRKGRSLARHFDEKLERAGISLNDDNVLINSHGNDISGFDILKMDKAFLSKAEAAGYNFITAAGTFDIKALRNLSAADIAKMGVSNATVTAMIRFHADDGNVVQQVIHRGSRGWGLHTHQLTKSIIKKAGKGVSLASGNNRLVGEGDEETAQFSQMTHTYTKTKQHVQQVQAYSRQYREAVGQRYNEWKERHARGNNNGSKTTRTETPKQNRAERRTVNPNAKDKYLKRENKRLKRKERSEKVWGAIDNVRYKLDIKQRLIDKAANTRLGRAVTHLFEGAKAFLLKAAATLAGGYVLVCGGIVVTILIISVIQSLMNTPFEGLKKLAVIMSRDDRPAMVVLYTYMNDELQESWLDGLRNYDAAFDEKENLKYTISYDDFNSYISTFDNIKMIGNDMYINPFAYVGNNIPEENLTPVNGYNGICDTAIIANPSVYGEKDGTDGYVSTESGHTNNIKDILAMTDIMYDFNVNKFGDDTLHDILQEPVAAIKFEHFWNTTTGAIKYGLKFAGTACKWVWNGLSSFFGGGSGTSVEFPSINDYWGGTVKYATIQNYVTELYLASHQEIYNLDVNFYPIKDVTVSVNGSATELASLLDERNASRLSICNRLTQSNFKLDYDGSKISDQIYPYLLNDVGNKVDLSEKASADETGIPLRMNGNYGHIDDPNEACLWDTMGENRQTYDKIVADNDCWKRSSRTEDYESYNTWSGWYDSESDARNAAYGAVYNKYMEYNNNPPSVPTEFVMSADRNAFTRVWKEACFRNDHFEEVKTRQVADGTEMKQWHWSGDLNAGDLGLTSDESKPPAFVVRIEKNGSEVFSDYTDENGVWWESYNSGAGIKAIYYKNHHRYEYDLGDEGSYSYNGWCEKMEYEGTKYKTQYMVRWSADVCCTYTEIYNRNCTGHSFSYSGGVVGCHNKGCVYSATNEQLALSGIYNSSTLVPVARDFDMLDHGYGHLIGKVVKKDVDYSTARSASTSGAFAPAATDVQGSDVSRGLNLYVIGDDELGKDMNVRTDVAPQTIRDIFDIDCMIDKGSNIFPWKAVSKGGKGWREYEGWTADNISLVCARITVDWNDVYGFDIPTELGSVSLSRNDIAFLSEALSMEYGTDYTDTRKEAVEFALQWISRGHYSTDHKDHAFLTECCKAHTMSRTYNGRTYDISYDANCTAANSQGFVDFYLNEFNKHPTNHYYAYLWQSLTSSTRMIPADVFYRKMERNYSAYDFTSADLAAGSDRITNVLCEFRDNDNYGIFIGELNNVFGSSIKVPDGIEMTSDTITLTNGYEIHKGVPITLDLSPEPREGRMFGIGGNDGAGTVRLRTGESAGYGQTNAEENFYWLLNPDSRTYYRSFE